MAKNLRLFNRFLDLQVLSAFTQNFGKCTIKKTHLQVNKRYLKRIFIVTAGKLIFCLGINYKRDQVSFYLRSLLVDNSVYKKSYLLEDIRELKYLLNSFVHAFSKSIPYKKIKLPNIDIFKLYDGFIANPIPELVGARNISDSDEVYFTFIINVATILVDIRKLMKVNEFLWGNNQSKYLNLKDQSFLKIKLQRLTPFLILANTIGDDSEITKFFNQISKQELVILHDQIYKQNVYLEKLLELKITEGKQIKVDPNRLIDVFLQLLPDLLEDQDYLGCFDKLMKIHFKKGLKEIVNDLITLNKFLMEFYTNLLIFISIFLGSKLLLEVTNES